MTVLTAGTRLGRYEITGKVGAGAMGEVYRATDSRLQREVAIKVLPAEIAADPERRRRFELEALAASALNDLAILTVHDVGTEADVAYLVTELLQGESLRDRLRRGPLPPAQVATLGAQVASGLAAAHGKGIVHRDLKPENLFVSPAGQVKILDFGLARVDTPASELGSLAGRETVLGTSAGTLLGTPGYMSPEQVRGERVDARSDLFSLGVVLQEMLTGSHPFQRDSVVETLHAILKEEPPACAASAGGDSELAAIVARCLEKEPARRFESAGALAAALHRRSEAAASAPTAHVPRLPAMRAHRARAAIAVASLLLVAAAGWLVLHAQRRATGAGGQPIRSLAVMPFASLSAASPDDYFSEGMTEALTTELSKLAALKVVSRTATARFRGSALSGRDVAARLGVAALLDGSVLRAGDQVRISAQLTAADDDRVLWAESYQRPVRDVLSLQGEVARAIAGAVALRLSPEEEQRLRAPRPVDPRALDEYLRGRHLWQRRSEDSVRAALAHFTAATEIDPRFALGHAGVADAYIILAAYEWMRPLDALPLAVAATERAQALDPTAGEPHASRGDLATHFDRDLVRASSELQRACVMSPSYAPAFHWRGEAALYAGRAEEAVRWMSHALELDPAAPAALMQLAMAQEVLGRHAEAEAGYRRALELSPSYPWPADELVRLDLARGRGAAAVASARARADADPSAENLSTLGVALALTGRADEAREVHARIEAQGRERWVSPYELAAIEAALGERDAMLAHLRTAVEESVFRVQAMSVLPDLEFRRYAGDPDFERIRGSIWRRR